MPVPFSVLDTFLGDKTTLKRESLPVYLANFLQDLFQALPAFLRPRIAQNLPQRIPTVDVDI